MAVLAFLTPVPHGHSNVHLAILRRLLELRPPDAPSQIHVLADEPLRKRILQLPSSSHTTVSFHVLDDEDVFAGLSNADDLRVPPLSLVRSDDLRALTGNFVPIICPPPSTNLGLRRYARISDVLRDIRPDLVVVDIFFSALGADVCRTLGLRHVMRAPCYRVPSRVRPRRIMHISCIR
jgi:hypothetical protein